MSAIIVVSGVAAVLGIVATVKHFGFKSIKADVSTAKTSLLAIADKVDATAKLDFDKVVSLLEKWL